MFHSLTITIAINRPHAEVYEFLAEPLNLPTWATGVERIEHREGDDWVASTSSGELIFRYTPRNAYGVLDFSIRRRDEDEPRAVPARVFANGDGAELTLTHYQRAGMSEAEFDSEAEWIRADFETLKALLEAPQGL